MGQIEIAYQNLYTFCLIVMGLCIVVALSRSVRGPEIADRILAINMIGTAVISAILVLTGLLEETWLLDICLVYVLISFLAVAVLATVYIRRQKKEKKEGDK
ncbi:MAG: sodium:proton antiporter [Clostridia bacterium]|nr:sodium:proton antiporter [Clostridia bacterium]